MRDPSLGFKGRGMIYIMPPYIIDAVDLSLLTGAIGRMLDEILQRQAIE